VREERIVERPPQKTSVNELTNPLLWSHLNASHDAIMLTLQLMPTLASFSTMAFLRLVPMTIAPLVLPLHIGTSDHSTSSSRMLICSIGTITRTKTLVGASGTFIRTRNAPESRNLIQFSHAAHRQSGDS
jgi:hypothetical protein